VLVRLRVRPDFFLIVIIFSLFFISSEAHAFGKKRSSEQVCPNLLFLHPISPDLNSNETRLACGKFPGDGSNLVQAWEHIPENQRQFNLKSFLQSRGYHHPVFTPQPDGHLSVDPGPLSYVTSLEVEGNPPEFNYDRKRKVIGQVLTPALLDDLKAWTKARLAALGYPCVKVEPAGDPDTGKVRVIIEAQPRVMLGEINEDHIPGLEPGILRRYDAFKIGQLYNGDLMTLSERRATADGQLEGLHYRVAECKGDLVSVDQETIIGKPRLLSFGAGVSSEGVVLGRASWSNTRLGRRASLLNVTLTASTIHQLLSTHAEYYFEKDPTRLYFRPAISIEHINWAPYETASATADLSPATSWDEGRWGGTAKLGPVYDYVRVLRVGSGVYFIGPPTGRYLFLEGSVQGATHEFDFYQASPRTGYSATLTADVNSPDAFSDYEAERVRFNFEGLWNFRDYDPPLWVIGVRGFLATTFTSFSNDPYGSNLPPTFLQFLGGSGDMRGFGLEELPHGGMGTLSAAYLGTELRYAGGLWLGIQPFGFMDFGALGNESAQLNNVVYLSPGIGIRVETILGSLRLTLAHGYAPAIADPSYSHYQVFFSFGQEF
jgi:outer membrane protein assembly factor BamA